MTIRGFNTLSILFDEKFRLEEEIDDLFRQITQKSIELLECKESIDKQETVLLDQFKLKTNP